MHACSPCDIVATVGWMGRGVGNWGFGTCGWDLIKSSGGEQKLMGEMDGQDSRKSTWEMEIGSTCISDGTLACF